MQRMLLFFLCTAISFPHFVQAVDEVNVNDYRWKGSPVILKTSQVFSSGEDRKKCGTQNYEVCVGPAELKTPPAEGTGNAIVVKCFIPKNQTICPSEISSTEQCFVATVGAPINAGTRPECRIGRTQFDGLTYGCHCGYYGRRNHVRPNAHQCSLELALRNAAEARRGRPLCNTTPYSAECRTFCTSNSTNGRINSSAFDFCTAVLGSANPPPVVANAESVPCDNGHVEAGVCQCDDHYTEINGICQLAEGGTCADETFNECTDPGPEASCH